MEWKLAEDRKTVAVTLSTTPPITLQFNADGVDELLRAVGALRAYMLPEHSHDDPRGKKHEGVTVDPRWAAEHDLMLADVLLHLRNPRYGLMSFLLPREQARNMGQVLLDLAAAPLPPSQSGRAN